MKKLTLFISFTVISLLCFSAFSANAQTGEKKTVVKSKKFERLLKRENVVLLDVRTANEFDSSHLPNAINIDVKHPEFINQVRALDTSKTYLIYCRSGKRSLTATEIMRKQGFEKIYQLKGGIEAWRGPKE